MHLAKVRMSPAKVELKRDNANGKEITNHRRGHSIGTRGMYRQRRIAHSPYGHENHVPKLAE